uniref:B30.2/SPRY domain-containing protein n=1 Tax=Cyprinus carpio TaxID=7962 RepID=A0A8C2DLM4_CYPCA
KSGVSISEKLSFPIVLSLANFCSYCQLSYIKRLKGFIIPYSDLFLSLSDSHLLTLDLNTINKHLCLSESNRVIANTDKAQMYPDHPDRFDQWFQVFCRERVCGRCYWEIEWSGDVFISVSYKSIIRKGLGKECVFGRNAKSWSLICTPSRYSFIHNNIETELPEVSSHRIGVYVDPSAGTLSFYSVSDTMSLIHTVQTTFTQPLYPGFWVGSGSSVKLC